MCRCDGFVEETVPGYNQAKLIPFCKCSHAKVRQTKEVYDPRSNQLVRTWICLNPTCAKTWEVNMGFDSQDRLEGRV